MTIRRLRAYKLIRPHDVVVAGYSLGGSLARDYAVAALRSGLPVPRALYAVFPGRGLCDEPTRLPPQPGEFKPGLGSSCSPATTTSSPEPVVGGR